MNNKEIAQIFRTIADILEIKDENFFRVRAYRRAAQNIENLTRDLKEITAAQQEIKIPGVGVDLKAKIEELVSTGDLDYFKKLKKSIPQGLLQIMSIPGVGPKKTKLLYEQLGVKTVAGLEKAVKRHALLDLFGMKEKTEENILKGIELIKQKQEKILLSEAQEIAAKVITQLKKLKQVRKIQAAGSLRRMKETVRDIDILVSANSSAKIMKAFTVLSLVKDVSVSGQTKSSVVTENNVQVDLRVVKPEDFGAALCYFTGSKEHNIRLRELAKKKGLKINEYGVFTIKNGKKIAGVKEKEVYAALKLSFVEPELRENKGEIEAAGKKALPELITIDDINADLHVHSEWSDGTRSVFDMAKEAKRRGYKYMVISDHSQGLGIARGLSPQKLDEHISEIKSLNKKLKGFKILCGSEVDIKSDGSLDYNDDVLKKLDVVLAAVHSGFKQSRDQLTMRIIRAMKNRYVNIIAHPFGRLINERPEYDFDFEEVLSVAKKTNTALEINSYPKRLDLDDNHSRRAKQKGVMLAINTDAHQEEQMDFMRLGVGVARRGWLEKKDVLNCLSCRDFLKRIKK